MVHPAAEAYQTQAVRRSFLPLATRHLGDAQQELDVFVRRIGGKQCKGLKDKAYVMAPQSGQLARAQL